jgi:hypothetical protein
MLAGGEELSGRIVRALPNIAIPISCGHISTSPPLVKGGVVSEQSDAGLSKMLSTNRHTLPIGHGTTTLVLSSVMRVAASRPSSVPEASRAISR